MTTSQDAPVRVSPGTSSSDSPLDVLLQPLVAIGADEDLKRDVLERLLVDVAAPLVRARLRTRIGEIGTSNRFSREDEEDIAAAVMFQLVRRLSHDLTEQPIKSFRDYVSAAATHAFNDHLRRHDPARTQLAATIVRLLRRDSRFDVWRYGGRAVGGRAEWRDQPDRAVDSERLRQALLSESTIIDALSNTFRIIESPVAISSLTALFAPTFVAAAVAPGEPVEEIAEEGPDPWLALHRTRTAGLLWREIKMLPPEQRLAILLHLRDASQSTALPLLLRTGVATLNEIAEALGLSDADLASLWPELPMPDEKIAARLATTRQRVINLRSSARKRLARRLQNKGSL